MRLDKHILHRFFYTIGWCISTFIFLGCETIAYMDKPLAPSKLMWQKNGVTSSQVDAELSDCGKRAFREGSQLSFTEKYAESDKCMLKKGFVFVPKPNGYPNLCSGQAFYDMPSCKSYRGEYEMGKASE